ncbi:hypothetical protein [Corynebacterium pacaense]|uniref:hypothetical protein n=1 Tax=Corynebacterium pacaense TaxID=1816684 RepID=UPI0009BACF48|nr:hypothetical protein [Corynebacterium pacaense]
MTTEISREEFKLFTTGPVTLAIGTSTGVSMWAITSHSDTEQLSRQAIGTGLSRLARVVQIPSDDAVSLYIEPSTSPSKAQAFDGSAGETEASRAQALLVAQALAESWRSAMQDISEQLGDLPQDSVKDLGRLDIVGRPFLNELVARRRRATDADIEELRKVEEVTESLRKQVEFGVAGFIEDVPQDLSGKVNEATDVGGWATNLTLLVAAQECLSTDVLAEAIGMAESESIDVRRAMDYSAMMMDQRRENVLLAATLREAMDALENWRPDGIAEKLNARSLSKKIEAIRRAAVPFIVRFSPDLLSPSEYMVSAGAGFSADREAETIDVDALASALGDGFTRALPEAKRRVDELRSTYPRDNAESLAVRLFRHFVDSANVNGEGSSGFEGDLINAVAEYAMALAIVRDVPVGDPDKRKGQARRLANEVKGVVLINEFKDNPLMQKALVQVQSIVVQWVVTVVAKKKMGAKGLLIFPLSKLIRALLKDFDDEIFINTAASAVSKSILKLLALAVDREFR